MSGLSCKVQSLLANLLSSVIFVPPSSPNVVDHGSLAVLATLNMYWHTDCVRKSSGVGLNAQCLQAFQDLKLGHKHKYIVYTLSEDLKEIVVEKTSSEPNYEAFTEVLPKGDCRWAVYDFDFELAGGGGKRNKLVLIAWCVLLLTMAYSNQCVELRRIHVLSSSPGMTRIPENAKIKQKMLHSSSTEILRRALSGIAAEIQGSDESEVTREAGE